MSSMNTNSSVYRNSNGSHDGGSSRGGGDGSSGGLVVTPNTKTKVTVAASGAVSAGTSLGLFADVHSLVVKVHQLFLEEEEEFEVEGSTDRRHHQTQSHRYDDQHHHHHHQQQQRFDHLRRLRREKAVREKELRQCLRKLHTIFQNEELHKVLLLVEDEGSGSGGGGGGGNVRSMDFDDDNDDEDKGSSGGGGGGSRDDDDDDEDQQQHKEEELQHHQHRRRQQEQQQQQHPHHLSHELITGFTEDLVELMTKLTASATTTTTTATTTTSTSITNDPSVVQLWKTLVPYSAILLPTSYLTEDQIWKLFVCVLQQLHDLDQKITNYNNNNNNNNNDDDVFHAFADDDKDHHHHQQHAYEYGYEYGRGGDEQQQRQQQSQSQQKQQRRKIHDRGGRMMDFSHVTVTDGTGTTQSSYFSPSSAVGTAAEAVATASAAGRTNNRTAVSATASASHHRHRQWPPSEIDREAFQGLLGQLLGALELNPMYFDGVLPPDEADEVLMRPIKFLCRLTRLEEQQQQQQQQHRSQQLYGGLPLDLVFSLRVLVDHLLANLKSAIVVQQQQQQQQQHNHDDEEEPSTALSFREWLQRKKKNNQMNNQSQPSSRFMNNQDDDDDDDNDQDDPYIQDINIIFNFLDEYAMDLADQAIHYLHDVETKTFLMINDTGRDDGQHEKETSSSSSHHDNTGEVITALQYANLASNFFFHLEQDEFYYSPQLQGLSRSLWHAVGEFALLVMESDGGGGGGLGRKGPINERPFLSLEWEATLTESLFRLTKTQTVRTPGLLAGPNSLSNDRLQDKELDYVVTTILRLLDNSARSIFSNDATIVSWVDELLKYSSFGRDKLIPPLRAALLSTICISGNYNTEKHDRLVSSLLKMTGLSNDDDDGDGDCTHQQPQVVHGQPETVNDVWKDYMLDQIYGKSFNDRIYY